MIPGVRDDMPDVRAIRRHVTARIEALRGVLEQPRDRDETQHLRGAIAELRTLLREMEPDEAPLDTETPGAASLY